MLAPALRDKLVQRLLIAAIRKMPGQVLVANLDSVLEDDQPRIVIEADGEHRVVMVRLIRGE